MKESREFYGTAKDKTLALVDGHTVGWPKDFQPATHGYRIVQPDSFTPRRVLGMRLDKFDLKQQKPPIEVSIVNAGGSANGGVIGGCSVYFVPKRVGNRWTVEFNGLIDP